MKRQSLLELIKKSEILVPSGASCEGNLQQRIRSLLKFGGGEDLAKMIYGVLPGDNTTVGGDKTVGVSLASPIAYDVWYLFHTANALPSIESGDDLQNEVLDGMSTFFDGLQGIKPLRTLRNAGDLGIGITPNEARSYFENNGLYLIKEMRFEQIPKCNSFEYPSDGNEANYVAFLAFPVGQLGVMENQSLVSEIMVERGILEDTTLVIAGGDLMPPVERERNACPGKHIIDTAYVKTDEERIEYISEKFEGHDNFSPHRWERYWIKEEDEWPVPGEFVGLVCRSLPWHLWWFQETFPFLYSGNWFDTGYYTSGIITEIIEEAENEETNIYKVLVRGLELCLRPSDFCGYEVGDRVAVLKKDGETSNFDWSKLDTWSAFEQKKATDSVVSCEDLVVVPITFYEDEV